MRQEIEARHFNFFDRRPSRKVLFTILAAGALGSGLLAGSAWMLELRPFASPAAAKAVVEADAPAAFAPSPFGALLVDVRRVAATSLSPDFIAEPNIEVPPAAPAGAVELNLRPTPAPILSRLGESAPLPPRRPAVLASQAASAEPAGKRLASLEAAADDRTMFERFFGRSQPPQAQERKALGTALAYAAPESDLIDAARKLLSGQAAEFDQQTAVYDISAHTVYMPDGTRLEAHSGLGDKLDNPRYVHVRMRGPTPPHVYDLSLREKPFHGVQAIRLTPIGGDANVFGRNGLLAHTYMLGPRGDSNGCVVFKNYDAFLRAFQKGEVKRLAVVSRLGG
jgi:hypothetical protein